MGTSLIKAIFWEKRLPYRYKKWVDKNMDLLKCIVIDVLSLEKTISAMVRVKNEEQFLYASIKSIINCVDEVIIIDNMSTDGTPKVIKRLEEEYRKKVKGYKYNYEVRRCGEDNYRELKRDDRSPHLLANFYNWCLDKCTCNYVLKWDGDMVATDCFKESVKRFLNSGQKIIMPLGVNVSNDYNNYILIRSEISSVPGKYEMFGDDYKLKEVRLFPKMFSKYKSMWCYEILNSPVVKYKKNMCKEREDICYIHLKYCKKDPFNNLDNKSRKKTKKKMKKGPEIDRQLKKEIFEKLRI